MLLWLCSFESNKHKVFISFSPAAAALVSTIDISVWNLKADSAQSGSQCSELNFRLYYHQMNFHTRPFLTTTEAKGDVLNVAISHNKLDSAKLFIALPTKERDKKNKAHTKNQSKGRRISLHPLSTLEHWSTIDNFRMGKKLGKLQTPWIQAIIIVATDFTACLETSLEEINFFTHFLGNGGLLRMQYKKTPNSVINFLLRLTLWRREKGLRTPAFISISSRGFFYGKRHTERK